MLVLMDKEAGAQGKLIRCALGPEGFDSDYDSKSFFFRAVHLLVWVA